jgi:hypothetical protein
MALFPLGILSAAGAGGADLDSYELINTQILATTATSVVFDVSSFASTYKHLQIRTVVKSSTTNAGVGLRFNGDTASNYNWHQLYGEGSSVGSAGVANQTLIPAGPLGPTTSFAAAVIDILDAFSATKNKTTRGMSGLRDDAVFQVIRLDSGAWRSTAATTSLTLDSGSATFAIGCRFSLYGIRG